MTLPINLSLHINHLNKAFKELIDHPTSTHINHRIVYRELLQYTDLPIANIDYALGFEYLSRFNEYFKEATGATPGFYRR